MKKIKIIGEILDKDVEMVRGLIKESKSLVVEFDTGLKTRMKGIELVIA